MKIRKIIFCIFILSLLFGCNMQTEENTDGQEPKPQIGASQDK